MSVRLKSAFAFILIGTYIAAQGQRSVTLHLAFQLLDQKGQMITRPELCSNWSIWPQYTGPSPCQPRIENCLSDSSAQIIFEITTYTNLYAISFVDGRKPKDTMTLVFDKHRNNIFIKRLLFKKGFFLIHNDGEASDLMQLCGYSPMKFYTINEVNWKKARKAFKSDWLARQIAH